MENVDSDNRRHGSLEGEREEKRYEKNRIRMFAWLLACTVTVTSVPATGTLVYASEDLFSDGEGTEVEYVEEVPVFDDGTGEEESTEEEVFTEEAEPVTTSLTEEEGIALLSENETVDTGLKVEENKTPEISVYQGEEVELVVKASINEGFGQISYKWYEGEYIYIYMTLKRLRERPKLF